MSTLRESKQSLNCPWLLKGKILGCGTTALQLGEVLRQHFVIKGVFKSLVFKRNWQQKQTLFVGNGGRKLKNNSGGKLHHLFFYASSAALLVLLNLFC